METKIKINRIVESSYDVYENGIKIGTINSHLELNDICIQVKKNNIENVYILDNQNIKHPIDKYGRVCSNGAKLYTTIGKQLRELI